MAIYHLCVKAVSRSTGRTAVAAAAYRSGERLTNAGDQVVHDYDRRRGVAARVLLVPDGAGGLAVMEGQAWRAERERVWNAAEAAETRKNSTVAREYELALPGELDEAGRQELAVEFAREVVTRFGVAADVAVHEPSRQGDQRNHHAHILTTTRKVEAGGALGAKTRELDDRKTGPAHVEALRELWAIQVNVALERIQVEARVDHRSHERRGLTAIPGVHVGAAATAMERRAQRENDERDGPDVPEPATRRERRQAEIAAMNATAEERRQEAEWVARRRQEAEERERQAEARRERERQEEAAAQAAQEPMETSLASPQSSGAPHPFQAPQRPLEAAQDAVPDRERQRPMPQGVERSKPGETKRPTRDMLAAMVRKARGEFLDEHEAEEDERERLAAMARMEAEHQARRAEAERVGREREERARAKAQRAETARLAAASAATGGLFQSSPEPFGLPSPDEAAWTTVRRQLVRERRLSERVVDGLKRLGLLIPRPRGFLLAMRDRWGNIVGAELYDGLGFLPFPRSQPDRGGVRLGRGPAEALRDVYLTEIGLDALSLHELVPPDPDRQQVFVSAAGARPRVAWLRELLERGSRLFVAYNANPASEGAARAIMAQYPTISVERWVPNGTDWNAQLVAVREAQEREAAQTSTPGPDKALDEDGPGWSDERQPWG